MTRAEAIAAVEAEIDRATATWKGWPRDPVHAAGVVAEEAGELMQAAMNHTYTWGNADHMMTEAVQTAATAIRFIIAHGSGHYERRRDELPEVACA